MAHHKHIASRTLLDHVSYVRVRWVATAVRCAGCEKKLWPSPVVCNLVLVYVYTYMRYIRYIYGLWVRPYWSLRAQRAGGVLQNHPQHGHLSAAMRKHTGAVWAEP
jgi:hypothetical protein